MIAAFDVQYFDGFAKIVGVLFQTWNDSEPLQILEKHIRPIADYEPGQFYKRELPCILGLLEEIDTTQLECIVVDGYVHLDDTGKPGLGHYLWKALDEKLPIIGVAKNSFHQNKLLVKQVLRGESKKPLYVTAVGIELNQAEDFITNMHGEFRMPTLLKIVDQRTKYPELTPNT